MNSGYGHKADETFEDGTDRFSQNIGKELPLLTA